MGNRILVETDGDVGGVRELHGMRVSSEQSQERRDDCPEVLPAPIERGHEAVVGARRLKDFVERFFASDILFPPQDGRGERFGIGEERFPTF